MQLLMLQLITSLNLGVSSDSQCSELPSNLQAGCHWRWEWYINFSAKDVIWVSLSFFFSQGWWNRQRMVTLYWFERMKLYWLKINTGTSNTSKSIVLPSWPASRAATQPASNCQPRRCAVFTRIIGRRSQFWLGLKHMKVGKELCC
jgi:hypothetical protein